MSTETENKKKKMSLPIILGLIAACAIVAALGFFGYRQRQAQLAQQRYDAFLQKYDGRFYAGTVINGIDADGKTPDEVEAALAETIDDYSLTLTFRDGKTETVSAEQIGYAYRSSGEVAELYADQPDPRTWYDAWLANGEQAAPVEKNVKVETVIEEDRVLSAVQQLPEMQKENMTAPEDAHMEQKDGRYEVVPEKEGDTLDPEIVLQAALEAANSRTAVLDVTALPGVYAAPKQTMETIGEELQKEADALNTYASASITYTLPGGREEVLDGTVTMDWLSVDEEGNYYMDEYAWTEHINEYVAALADRVDTVGNTRTFQATGIGPVQVSGGNYGYRLNVEQETAQLTQELADGTITTREPVYSDWEVSEENGGIGNSYVEIDVSRQHLWIYVDGVLQLETDVVTGKMRGKLFTPAGVCMLAAKQRDATLTGERSEYHTKVAYWMPFNGGVGMHDAGWRGAFGGDIYLYDGSHGCINMPVDAAAMAFDIVTMNMPIVVYYSEPYSIA